MNPGIVTSLIVGGMLMASMLALSARLSQNAGNTSLDLVAKTNVQTVSDIVQADVRRIGFGVAGVPILVMNDSTLSFRSTYNTDSTLTVTWQFLGSQPVAGTEHPDDRILRRTVDGVVTDIPMVVTGFELAYFDAAGAATAVPADVRTIRIRITTGSPVEYADYYGISHWEGTISPRALQ